MSNIYMTKSVAPLEVEIVHGKMAAAYARAVLFRSTSATLRLVLRLNDPASDILKAGNAEGTHVSRHLSCSSKPVVDDLEAPRLVIC